MASTTASVTSFVVAVPPTSGVMMPAPVTFSTARISLAEASASPRWSSICDAVQKLATGLAMPLPVISKAEPWIGSNIEGKRRPGSILAVGATPRLPASAPARSDRISAWRLVATMVSRLCGLSVIRTVLPSPKHFVPGDVGKFVRDFLSYLIPHHHAVALGIGLCDDGEEFARPRLRQLERI